MKKFLTEAKKFFLIHNTESLFVQYGDRFVGDRFVCVYMSDEKFERCHYDHNNILVIEYYICESQFKSLYRKFLDLLDLTDNTFEKIVKSNYIEC